MHHTSALLQINTATTNLKSPLFDCFSCRSVLQRAEVFEPVQSAKDSCGALQEPSVQTLIRFIAR